MYFNLLNFKLTAATRNKQISNKTILCKIIVLAEFAFTLREQCGCPVPCHFAIYDPSLSYASISNHLAKKLLTSSQTQSLKQKFEEASEVTAKMDRDTFNQFKTLVTKMTDKYAVIKDIINKVSRCLQKQTNFTADIHNEMNESYTTKERIYRYQMYTIEKNFLRGREAMEERTLTSVANAYAEFALLNLKRVQRLAYDDELSDIAREEMYKITIDELETRQEICQMAKRNISLLLRSFINGTKIFNYKFEDLPRAHNNYIIPKPLLYYSMTYNDYMEKYVPKLRTSDFSVLNKSLELFKEQATIAYETKNVSDHDLNYAYERFQFACRTYMYSKSVVYSMGIDLPLKVLQERHSDFEKEWDDFVKDIQEMNQNFKSLDTLIEVMTNTVFPVTDEIVRKLRNYTENNKGSLMDMAKTILSNGTQLVISTFKNFFREVRTRGQLIDDMISLVGKPINNMWTMIIDDEDSFLYYNYTNNVLFMRNLSEVLDEWNSKLDDIRALDVRRHVLNKDEDFLAAFDEISLHLEEFKGSLVVDRNFLK